MLIILKTMNKDETAYNYSYYYSWTVETTEEKKYRKFRNVVVVLKAKCTDKITKEILTRTGKSDFGKA